LIWPLLLDIKKKLEEVISGQCQFVRKIEYLASPTKNQRCLQNCRTKVVFVTENHEPENDSM
jgi:hypothetical protein